MAEPLAAYIQDQLEFRVSAVLGAEATKETPGAGSVCQRSQPWCTRQAMVCLRQAAT